MKPSHKLALATLAVAAISSSKARAQYETRNDIRNVDQLMLAYEMRDFSKVSQIANETQRAFEQRSRITNQHETSRSN